MLLNLTLDSINDIDDGRPAKAFMHELKRAVLDCMDRPSDDKPREVTMVLKLTPITSSDNGVVICEGAHGEFKFKSKVPERVTKTYSFRTDKAGHLIYSTESPENADQTTFDDIDPDTVRVNRQPK